MASEKVVHRRAYVSVGDYFVFGALCGQRGDTLRSEDLNEVTCKKCRRIMGWDNTPDGENGEGE